MTFGLCDLDHPDIAPRAGKRPTKRPLPPILGAKRLRSPANEKLRPRPGWL